MISLQALMAIDMEMVKDLGIIALALILIVAFSIGFSKGVREVGKGGLLWALAGVAFIFLYEFIGKDNPLGNILSGPLLSFIEFIWALVLIVVCIVATLVLAMACGAIFRPIEDEGAHMSMTIDGLEYEIEEMQVAHPVLRETTKYVPRLKAPSFWGRLFGGIVCILNVAVITGIVGLSLVILASTSSVGASLASLFEAPVIGTVMTYAKKYIFDVVTVGIVFAVTRKGFRTGFVGTTRILVARLGMMLAIVVGFILPFLQFFQGIEVFNNAIGVIASKLGKIAPLDEIAAKAILGVAIATVLCLLVAGLNALLRDLTYNIEDTKVIRFLDGAIASVIYVIVGAGLCVLLWGGLYVVDYVGVCDLGSLLAEGESFSNECFKIASKLFSKIADTNLSGLIGG